MRWTFVVIHWLALAYHLLITRRFPHSPVLLFCHHALSLVNIDCDVLLDAFVEHGRYIVAHSEIRHSDVRARQPATLRAKTSGLPHSRQYTVRACCLLFSRGQSCCHASIVGITQLEFSAQLDSLVPFLRSPERSTSHFHRSLIVGTSYISTLVFAGISDAKAGRAKTITFGECQPASVVSAAHGIL